MRTVGTRVFRAGDPCATIFTMTSSFDSLEIERLRRRRTAKWTEYGDDVLPAWIAEMDFSVAEPVRIALLEAVEREDFGYSPRDAAELREACSRFFALRYGWQVDAGHIFLVPDVLEGITASLDQFSPPGGSVIVPTPAYPPFFETIRLHGRTPVEVPMAESSGRPVLNLPGIASALDAGAHTVLLCHPHNPTGHVLTVAELTGLADLVEQHGARVISDEVHAPLTYPDRRHVPYARVRASSAMHSVTVTSTSKGWNLAGLKCAQVVVTNDADAEQWTRIPVFAIGGRSPLGIAASLAAYTAGVPWLDEVVGYLDHTRAVVADLLAAELPGTVYRMPEATYLAWLDCRPLGLADPAAFFLERARVALSDGSQFGAAGKGFVRLNFATSRELLQEMIEAMGAAVRSRPSTRHGRLSPPSTPTS